MPIDFIIGGIVAVLVILIIVRSIRKAKKGESDSCSCGCSSCPIDDCAGRKTNSDEKKW